MSDQLPCVRGCVKPQTDTDAAPIPKPARHGNLCDSCFYRLKHALDLIPDLMANMRALIVPGGGQSFEERVQGGGDGSPAPLRVGPLDASDSLYAKLVSWTDVFAGLLSVPQPAVAVWINFREVQGSRPVTVERAHMLATTLCDWYQVRLEQITASELAAEFHDDLIYGWEDARGVFSLAAAYGVEARKPREADKRECPLCGAKEIFVSWPNKFNPEIAVLCGRCAHVIPPEFHGQYAQLFA